MAKRSRKRTANGKDNVGCMWGLISMFRHSRGSRKLLTDGRHGIGRSASWNKHPRQKHTLMNSTEEKHGEFHYADENGVGQSNLNSANVKVLAEKEMFSAHKHKQISYVEPRKRSADHEAHCDGQIPGSPSNTHSSDSGASTNLEISGQLRQLQKFSSDLNFGSLLQELSDNKHGIQNIAAHYMKSNFPRDHILLQEILNDVLEPFYRYFEASHIGTLHQSEEFLKTLEILGSDKDMLLKVLQDPYSFLRKQIEDHLSALLEKEHAPVPCMLLEAKAMKSSALEQHGKAARHKIFHKQSIKNIFSKKNGRLHGEKNSDNICSSQPLKRIVLLKPATAKKTIQTNAGSPASSPTAPCSPRVNMQNERAVFGFTLRSIKRKLRHAIGESKLDQLSKQRDVPQRSPCRFPATTQSSFFNEQVYQTEILGKRTETVVKPRDYLMGEHWPSTYTSISLENVRSGTHHGLSAPRCSPKRCNEFSSSPQSRICSSWSLSENGDANQNAVSTNKWDIEACASRTSDDSLHESNSILPIEVQRRGDTPVEESPSSRCSAGREEELQISSPHQGPSQQVDGGIVAYDAECSPCTSNSSDTDNSESDCRIEESYSTTEAFSSKWSGNDMSMKGLNSTEVEGKMEADVVEGCEHDGPALQRLGSSAEEPTIAMASVPPGVLNVQDSQSPENIMEKPERPSPVSVLEQPFSDDIISPARTTEHAEFPISPRKLDVEEYDFDVVTKCPANPVPTKQRICMDDEEFKHKYITSLLEASELNSYQTWQNAQFTEQLLDPLLYDVVETSTGEIPDDLPLLFDRINEVLEKIHAKYLTRCTIIHQFPSEENLTMQVLAGIKCDFAPEDAHTLYNIIRRDIDGGAWMRLQPGSEDVEAEVEDEIFREMLEDVVLELWD